MEQENVNEENANVEDIELDRCPICNRVAEKNSVTAFLDGMTMVITILNILIILGNLLI